MRKDFNKVLTERPRVGHKDKHKLVRKKYNSSFDINDEDGPLGGTEGMKKPYSDRKRNSDLWAAIRRFMASRVGCLWDDVWSEVNRDLHESDDMRAHWRVHCKIEVDEKVAVAPNGKLWRLAGRGGWIFDSVERNGWPLEGIPGCNKRFYVDPHTGILRKTPKMVWPERAREIEHPPHGYLMDDGVQIKYIEGIWYAVTVVARKMIRFHPERIFGEKVLRPAYTTFEMEYDYHKRQLNKKELKKYEVRNSS